MPLQQSLRCRRLSDKATWPSTSSAGTNRLSKQPKHMPRFNLLLIEKAGKFHYTWIKDLNRLLYDQRNHRERNHFCERCLHGYIREDLLEAHRPACRGIGQTVVQVEMPEEGKLTFQNHHKQLPAPYIIYADFEALTTKIEGPELDPTKSNTTKTQQHETCSYSYVVVRCDGETEPPVEYRGSNAAQHFLQALQEEERKIKGVLANPKAMRMTPEDWQTHKTATTSHMCLQDLARDSVRDHCHTIGKYRDAAHSACNLKLLLNPKATVVPVIFHNLHGYDSDLLMQAISKVEGNVSCIPNNTEKYISFSLGQLRFIDNAQFLLALLTRWWRRTGRRFSRSQRNTSRTRLDAKLSRARMFTPRVHGLLGALTEVEKLVPNLRNKDRYVLHYRNQQLYMSLGMRETKIVPSGSTKDLGWSHTSG